MTTIRISALVAILLAACATQPQEATVSAEQYKALVANPMRTERDRGMDERRHPVELLEFAQVRPGMQVLDVVAGGGYTSQLLALAVAPGGRVWAQSMQPNAILAERLAKAQPTLLLAK